MKEAISVHFQIADKIWNLNVLSSLDIAVFTGFSPV
jgi:hypothetical protein